MMSDLGSVYSDQFKKQFALWGSALAMCELWTMGDQSPNFDLDVIPEAVTAITAIPGVLFEPIKAETYTHGDSKITVNTTAIFSSDGMPVIKPRDQISVTATGAVWLVMGGSLGSVNGLHVLPVFQIK